MVVIGRGPRAVEAQLLAMLSELDLAPGSARGDPAALARPVRIVVPSRSLAQHLSVRIAQGAGRPLLGLSVRTVHALACEIVRRAGEALPAGEGLFDVMVRRAAREEPALAPLAELVDGHIAVSASVRDLLDAGVEPAHAEALSDALDAASGPGDAGDRARAVVRIACRIAREIDGGAFGHRSRLFRAAREILERDPLAALPARAILIHGFADATGVVADLLEALVRRAGAVCLLDRPPDPAEPAREDPGVRFGERFASRLLGGPPKADASPAPPTALRVLHATGAWAEARAVAQEIRAALDGGDFAPEALGVVARDLGPMRLALRSHLRRLGIPYSGLGEPGPPGPAGRRLADLCALLREGPRARVERWLDALEIDRRDPAGLRRLSLGERADLQIALHALGAARLGAASALSPGGGGDLPLPVRAGIFADDEGGARARRRRLPRALLDAAIARARDLLRRHAALAAPGARTLAECAAALRGIACDALGWREDDPGAPELLHALEDGSIGPPELRVDREELRLLLERRLAGEGRDALGGAGGGVQVLSVTEARARTFEGLWVIGLRRDLFPRAVTEDPLLPDALREVLRAVLPDLPRKRDGHDEERFLFAQLAAASPRVALVASSCDDDGRAQEISPLVERLRRAPHVGEPVRLPGAASRDAISAAVARPAHEVALQAGLHADAKEFDGLLPVALAEALRDGGGAGDGAALAAARLAVLREIDRPAHRAAPLGPYFGFLGPLRAGSDPRRGPIAVTTLEGLFRCPWQTFLAKLLRIEAPPDAGGALPDADPLRLGAVVHGVLERLAQRALGPGAASLAEAATRRPVALAWPSAEELDALALEVARERMREEGIGLRGFERVLAVAARAPLAVARALDSADPRDGNGLVAAESTAALRVAGPGGEPRELQFRIDRVDRRAGALVLLDYKTGKPKVQQADEARRREALLAAIEAGELLQGSAYAAAAREHSPRGAQGRYRYLREDATEVVVDAADAELARAFDGAVRRALAAWDAGSFFPRLVEPDREQEGRACRTCELREPCSRGDSSARGRLARWAADPPRRLSGDEEALLGLWRAEARE